MLEIPREVNRGDPELGRFTAHVFLSNTVDVSSTQPAHVQADGLIGQDTTRIDTTDRRVRSLTLSAYADAVFRGPGITLAGSVEDAEFTAYDLSDIDEPLICSIFLYEESPSGTCAVSNITFDSMHPYEVRLGFSAFASSTLSAGGTETLEVDAEHTARYYFTGYDSAGNVIPDAKIYQDGVLLSPDPALAPEPSSLLLLLCGGLIIAWKGYRSIECSTNESRRKHEKNR